MARELQNIIVVAVGDRSQTDKARWNATIVPTLLVLFEVGKSGDERMSFTHRYSPALLCPGHFRLSRRIVVEAAGPPVDYSELR